MTTGADNDNEDQPQEAKNIERYDRWQLWLFDKAGTAILVFGAGASFSPFLALVYAKHLRDWVWSGVAEHDFALTCAAKEIANGLDPEHLQALATKDSIQACIEQESVKTIDRAEAVQDIGNTLCLVFAAAATVSLVICAAGSRKLRAKINENYHKLEQMWPFRNKDKGSIQVIKNDPQP